MVPIYGETGEVARDADGNVIYKRTLADDELQGYPKPSITFGGTEVPVWLYIEMYCPIEDRESNLSGFELNKSQIEEYKAMSDQYVEEGRIRLNIGKSRQMGGTTLISAFLWTLALKPGTKVGIIADTEAKGIGILSKYKVFYANSPEPLRTMLRKCEAVNNSKELTFDFGKGRKTSFVVLTQGDGAGVSFHFNLIHESEVAVWDNILITISKLEKTVSNADPRSVIVRETTARGHNDWEKLYLRGKYRKGTFRSIFVPWHWEPSYRARYDGHPLNEYELRLRDEFGLDDSQIQFWHDAWQDVGGDYNELAAEYPTDDVEMFNSTAVSIFPAQTIEDRRREIEARPYLRKGYLRFGLQSNGYKGRIDIVSPKWVEDPNGPCEIYSYGDVNHPMFVCVDPAKGGTDYWAAHVYDNNEFREVACYHQQANKVESDKACLQAFALLVACQCGCFSEAGFDASSFSVGTAHNLRAGVTAERNTTEEPFDIAYRMGLRNIPRDGGKDGYRTGVDNRQTMIDLGRQMLRDTEGRCVSSMDTLLEMAAFQYQRTGRSGAEKAMALDGAHDDLVMSFVGACYMRTYFPTIALTPKAEVTRKVAFDPLARDVGKTERHPIRWRD